MLRGNRLNRDGDYKIERIYIEEGDYNVKHTITDSKMKPWRKTRGHHVQKHQRLDGGINQELLIESTTAHLNNRKTQTPIREVFNEGIQYNEEDIKHFRPLDNRQRHSTGMEMDPEERLPFSTIKK